MAHFWLCADLTLVNASVPKLYMSVSKIWRLNIALIYEFQFVIQKLSKYRLLGNFVFSTKLNVFERKRGHGKYGILMHGKNPGKEGSTFIDKWSAAENWISPEIDGKNLQFDLPYSECPHVPFFRFKDVKSVVRNKSAAVHCQDMRIAFANPRHLKKR